MPKSNSTSAYGSVAKAFHWATALLILTIIPVGIIANNLTEQLQSPEFTLTEAAINRVFFLFSLHKTLGVTIFFVALARILWAITQPKPGLLNGDHKIEAITAETVHWLLYGSLLLVPLSGWAHHAATTGFAPIWWPFGQSLPFIPKNEAIAAFFSSSHHVFLWVLIGSVVLHILGALKHHLLDGDATLRRMLPGRLSAVPTTVQPNHALPVTAAVCVWLFAFFAAMSLGWFNIAHAIKNQDNTAVVAAPPLDTQINDWIVDDGTLNLTVRQLGSSVTGEFTNWDAHISYTDTADVDGKHGTVTVQIDTSSIKLGTVSDQSKGSDYLDATSFPTAAFTADILSTEQGLAAIGALTIRDISVPASIPFTLSFEEGTAKASGKVTLDRRDFNIGNGVADAGSLGFEVIITFDLTATQR